MFEVSVSGVFFIYLFIAMSVVLLFWVIDEHRSKTKSSDADLSENITCPVCLQNFLAVKGRKTARCPCCNSLTDI